MGPVLECWFTGIVKLLTPGGGSVAEGCLSHGRAREPSVLWPREKFHIWVVLARLLRVTLERKIS